MAKPITVQIIGDAKQFQSALGNAEQSLGSFGTSGALTFAGVAGAALAVGTTLFELGQSVDEAFDRLQVGTGASGEALASLESSVNSIAQTVPSAFGDIADAVTLVYQRLDETGAPLDALATQLLNLSRITGTDLHQNVDAVTGMINNWHIATADQTSALDELFRASQLSGVAVSELASILAANGAVLRQAGLDLTGATALIASLGKEGVNAQQAITGLRTAISNTAADSVKASQTQARAAQDAADRAVAAAHRRQAAEERLAEILKSNARQAEDAAKRLADATSDQAEVEADAAKDVARAKEEAAKLIEKVQDPVNNGAVAMANYQKRLEEAQKEAAQKVADAEEAAAKRRRDAAARVADSQQQVARVAEDSEDRVAKAKQQAADADEKAGARVRASAAGTSAAVVSAGQSSQDSIAAVIKKIQELGPSAEAQQLAIETFGSRAGAQLYDQLTQGKQGMDNLRDAIANGKGTINQAAADTADFGESWQRLKNDILVPLEPIVVGVFDGISTALEDLVNYFPVGVQVIKDSVKDLVGSVGDFFSGGIVRGLTGHAAGGQIMTGGWSMVGERGPEAVWLPQGAQVAPSWTGGGRGGDTYNINGSNVSAAELAREISWQRRRGAGR